MKPKLKSRKPNIILWDLEVLADHSKLDDKTWFGMGNWPGRGIKASINSVLCFGWKRLGEARTHCVNAWDFPGWRRNVNDDRGVLLEARRILSEADGIITHYGKGFDLKFLNHRLQKFKIPRLPPLLHVDTKAVASRNLFAYSNSLGALADELNVPHKKIETSGKNLWMRCRLREPAAMREMERYCKGDVRTLEGVFEELRSYATDLPDFNLFIDEERTHCPNCGSEHFTKQGKRVTKGGWLQRYQCQTCGTWRRVSKKGKLKQ